MTEKTSMTHMGQSAGAYPGVKPSNLRTAQGVPAAGPGRRIERIADVSEIERALELAAVTLKPDELSARQLINRLMPSLYTLRKKAFSFAQLTGVLNQAIKGKAAPLQTATVKAYYNEFIAGRLDDLDRNLRDALEITKEVEKLTKSAPKDLIAEAVGLKNALGAKQPSVAGRFLDRQPAAPGEPMASEIGRPVEQIGQTEMVLNPAEIAPPSEGSKPPSAAGSEARIGGAGGARKEPSAPAPSIATGDPLDDIPIATPIAVAPSQGQQGNPPASVDQGQENQAPGQTMICTTTPTKESMHPVDSEMFDGIAREFFSSLALEHPSIPGLMLSKEQRLFKERLKYTVDGVAKGESVQQMFNRLKWKKPERQSVSRTQGDFVPMNPGLFKTSE